MGTSEPPETDLDYYARPENYTGSNLTSLRKFLIAKDKEGLKERKQSKKKKDDSDQKKLFRRYRHILTPDIYDGPFSSSSSDDEKDDINYDKEKTSTKHSKEISAKTKHTRTRKDGVQQIDTNVTDSPAEVERETSFVNENGELSSESGYVSRLTDESSGSKLEVQDSNKHDEKDGEQERKISDGEESQDLTSGSFNTLVNSSGSKVTSDPPSRSSVTSLQGVQGRRESLSRIIAFKGKLLGMSQEARQRLQRRRFQKLVIGVINILKLAKAIIKPTNSPSALLKTFTAMAQEPKSDEESENMKSYGLHFDPSYYRANKEISVSSEVKSILRRPPSLRTNEQIQTAMFGLQSLPSFAEYPLHMQEKLTRVAWFEKVTPMRTIIRQGHTAENFYFILSGQALVTIHKPGQFSAQTAGMMRKGTSFGELALLHHSKRTATVTSHDTVQLLSIGREDFFEIFMARHEPGDMPEHIKFISQLDFMKDWPLERLLERPDQCLLNFFKRNTVIIKDSIASEWLYVVKSGSCQVLKQLKGVTGQLGQSQRQGLIREDRMGRLRNGANFQYSRIENGRRRKMLTSPRSRFDVEKYVRERDGRDSKASTHHSKCSDDSSTESEEEETEEVPRFGSRRPFSKLRYSKQPNTGPPHFGRQPKQIDRPNRVNSPSAHSHHHHNKQEHLTHRPHRGRPTPPPPPATSQQLPQQQQQEQQPPVFVQVEILKPRDVFGLDVINFNSGMEQRSSSVSLVSLGAECIMLSKTFFMKHANDRVKKHFSEIVQPYPDDTTLQDSLQSKANWELYKQSLLSKLTAPKPTGLRGQPLTTHW